MIFQIRRLKNAVLTLAVICILLSLTACSSINTLINPNINTLTNPVNNILTFQGLEYAGDFDFQINPAYFKNGSEFSPPDEYFTKIGSVASCDIYWIKGLDTNVWIYYPFGNCDQGFYLSKNVDTQLGNDYFDFTDTLEVLVQYYTIKDGAQTKQDKEVTDKSLVDYISKKLASKEIDTDIGEIAEEYAPYMYTIFLTPKLYPALQFRVSYCEASNGYFMYSNIPSDTGVFPAYIKIDDSIHRLIN